MILAALIHTGKDVDVLEKHIPIYGCTDMFPEPWALCSGMRLASPSTKVEFEYYYLMNTRFYFDAPRHLGHFLDSLSTYQQNLLRYLAIDMSRRRQANDWVAYCACLPPNLVSIHFRITTGWSDVRETGGEWLMCRLEDNFPRLKNIVEFLNDVGKRARRCAAKAKIDLSDGSSGHKFKDSDKVKSIRVLDEVEPWSKKWLEWREEDTKPDNVSEKEVNDMA